MAQVSASSQGHEDEAPDAPAPAAAPQVQTDAVDALLDEIDVTLEQNAQEFVRSFVQKGGQ